jgi:type II secretory pathway pseudopilin PulG
MNYRSKKNPFYRRTDDSAFTLIEVVMAVTIITVTVATVLTVMNRCLEAAIDNRTRMQAFELARENMEKLLALDSVSDQAEFGISEKNPDIQWTSVVETFTEPADSEMWVRAVCSATYTDSKGQEQSIELNHWLSEVPKNIQKMITAQKEKELELMEMYGIDKFGEPVQPEDSPELERKPIDPCDPSKPPETPYSEWCVSYGLPPDCETWPIDQLLRALGEARK